MKFDILVVDPPWSYNRKSTGGTNKSGSVQKYDTMTLQELEDLYHSMENLIADNSVLFLWSTVPMLEEAIHIMKWWGYDYKTMITWVKKNYGLGNYFRGKTEHLLVGIRGKKVKPFRLQSPNLIISDKVLKHSEKPEESYTLIQKCANNLLNEQDYDGDVKILELFARKQRIDTNDYSHWTYIGVDITGNDIKTDLQNLVGTVP